MNSTPGATEQVLFDIAVMIDFPRTFDDDNVMIVSLMEVKFITLSDRQRSDNGDYS